jgi:hypothetical protein
MKMAGAEFWWVVAISCGFGGACQLSNHRVFWHDRAFVPADKLTVITEPAPVPDVSPSVAVSPPPPPLAGPTAPPTEVQSPPPAGPPPMTPDSGGGPAGGGL